MQAPSATPAAGDVRRVVVLSSCPDPWGGSEELWFEAACALRARGARVEVLKTLVDPDHVRIRHLEQLGCGVRDLCRTGPERLWHAAGLVFPARLELTVRRRQLGVLVRALRLRGRPDIAIVSQGANFDGAYLARACARLGVPYVLVSQKASEHQWPSDARRPASRDAHLRARRSVFVSEHNLRLTERQLGERIEHAVVLPNPVLVARGSALPWPGARDGGLRLACVGRLFASEKGQDLLLQVLARERWRQRPVRVSFHGEGANREGLEALARHLDLASVSFEGQAPDIEDVWRTHHALVLPSRAEGLPLALLEAMACGRVPIVTDVGGNAEVVEDAVSGFIASSPTVDAFDAALERAWARRDEWEGIGAAAARRVAEKVLRAGHPTLTDIVLEASAGRSAGAQAGARP